MIALLSGLISYTLRNLDKFSFCVKFPVEGDHIVRALFLALSLVLFSAWDAPAQEAGPDVTAIVQAHETFKNSPDKETRKALFLALNAYTDDPTNESVSAYNDLVSYDFKSNKPKNIRESAFSAAQHTKPVADIIPKVYSSFAFLAASTLFQDKQSKDAILEMAHVQGFAHQISVNEQNESSEWAENTYYRAMAWTHAMKAYRKSVNKKTPTNDEIESILRQYGADFETTNSEAEERDLLDQDSGEAVLPFCKGELSMKPRLSYPKKAARKRQVGAVITKITTDDAGNIIDASVLASAPDEGFKDQALKTILQWRYLPSDSELPGETCRLNRENILLPAVFQMR